MEQEQARIFIPEYESSSVAYQNISRSWPCSFSLSFHYFILLFCKDTRHVWYCHTWNLSSDVTVRSWANIVIGPKVKLPYLNVCTEKADSIGIVTVNDHMLVCNTIMCRSSNSDKYTVNIHEIWLWDNVTVQMEGTKAKENNGRE